MESQVPNIREKILEAARVCVCGHRTTDYGKPENNFKTIADLWTVYLHSAHPDACAISATDVTMMMALLKIARISSGTSTADSFVDLAGYAACGGELAAQLPEDKTIDHSDTPAPSSDCASIDKKYELTDKTIIVNGTTLYLIKAIRDFGSVHAGDLGGYIQSEANLSHNGNCWIYNKARVWNNAQVYGNAQVYSSAWVYGHAQVYGDAQVCGNARVWNHAQVCGDAVVYGNAQVYDNAQVYGNARVYGDVTVDSNIKICNNT